MHKARAFFFVCAGIFLLAITYHLGARSAGAQAGAATASEVAVVSGTAHDMDVLPLPTYSDGTVASESECRWIVSLYSVTYYAHWGQSLCYTTGLTVHIQSSNGDNTVSYLIIATRGAAPPTPAQSVSIGRLKAKYAK